MIMLMEMGTLERLVYLSSLCSAELLFHVFQVIVSTRWYRQVEWEDVKKNELKNKNT